MLVRLYIVFVSSIRFEWKIIIQQINMNKYEYGQHVYMQHYWTKIIDDKKYNDTTDDKKRFMCLHNSMVFYIDRTNDRVTHKFVKIVRKKKETLDTSKSHFVLNSSSTGWPYGKITKHFDKRKLVQYSVRSRLFFILRISHWRWIVICWRWRI